MKKRKIGAFFLAFLCYHQKPPACVLQKLVRCTRICKHIAPPEGEGWRLASTVRGASCGVTAPSHACKQAREPLALLLHASASAG